MTRIGLSPKSIFALRKLDKFDIIFSNFPPKKASCNEEKVANELDRQFNQKEELAVVVSDLTYVRVNKKMELCMFIS